MKKRAILIPFLLVCLALPQTATATIKAVTEAGEVVLLHPDGTWEYLTEPDAEKGEPHFRNARWGMSPEEVVTAEGREPDRRDQEALYYATSFGGQDAVAVYFFTDGALSSAAYTFDVSYLNPMSYVRDFLRLKEELEAEYGTPTSDRNIWRDTFLRGFLDEGTAVEMGLLTKVADWKTPETEIRLWLSGQSLRVNLMIYYKSMIPEHPVEDGLESQPLEPEVWSV